MKCINSKNIQYLKKIRKDHAGSYTVEAAFVIPVTLFLIMSLITLAFSLYNRCSMERAACVSALRASEQIFSDNEQKNDEAGRAISDVLSYNLLFADEVEKKISIKGNTINIWMSTEEKTGNFTTKAEKKAINPILFVRMCRKMEGGSQYDAGRVQKGRP